TVLNAPLHKHSTDAPSPSPALHAGMCTPTNPIAAILTTAFLDFCASTDTDLRKSGVEPGQRFCLEASAWKRAADQGGDMPRVKLESTHGSALEKVDLGLLKSWAAPRENGERVVWPKEGGEGWVRESGGIGGVEPRA
ncbi:hypothetical protein BDW02DRAFT_511622, partial [Decorospora gaudefroyi]